MTRLLSLRVYRIRTLLFTSLLILPCVSCVPVLSGTSVSAAETEASTELSSDAEISSGSALDALYEFRVEINDETLQIPLAVSDFTAQGWEYVGSADTEIAANSYSPTEEFQKDDFHIYALVQNTGKNPAPVSDCRIAGIFIDETQVEDANAAVELPGGIQFGSATLEDLLTVYGNPTDREDGEDSIHLTYELENYRRADLYIDTETGVLDEIDLQNMTSGSESAQQSGGSSDSETVTSTEEAETEAAKLAASWQAPDELGDDLLSWNVEYGGDLYHLPAPVSAFTANGWTVNETDSDSILAGQDFGWVYLQKDDQEFYAIVLNYSDYAAPLEDCFVTSVEASTDSIEVSINLPGGITLGISEADLLSLLNGTDYTIEEDSEDETKTTEGSETDAAEPTDSKEASAESEGTEPEFDTEETTEDSGDRTYTIEDPDNSLNFITITVEKESSTVTGIEISHVPDSL